MNRQEKEAVIQTVKDEFKNSKSSFVVGMQGMTVGAVQGLRKNLRLKGGTLKVTKNTLLKIAVQGSALEELSPYFKDQIAVIFVDKDITGVAKILYKAAKENNKLTVIVGSIDERIINQSKIKFLASLPSDEIVKAQFCGALKSPLTKFANILYQVRSRLAVIVNKIAEKRQENS